MFLFPRGCLSAATEAVTNYNKFSSDGWWLTNPAKSILMSLDVTRLWEGPALFSAKHIEFWWVFQKYFPLHCWDACGHLCQTPQIFGPLGTPVLELQGNKGDTEPWATMEHLSHKHWSSGLSLAAHPSVTIAWVQRLVCVSGNGV